MEVPFKISKILKDGDGMNYPKAGDTVTVHYTGKLKSNSKKFDSSLDRGEPFKCKIGHGQVIQGWEQGIPQISLGEKAVLDIRSDFGYGAKGAGSLIPPNADLSFEIELLAINKLKAPDFK